MPSEDADVAFMCRTELSLSSNPAAFVPLGCGSFCIVDELGCIVLLQLIPGDHDRRFRCIIQACTIEQRSSSMGEQDDAHCQALQHRAAVSPDAACSPTGPSLDARVHVSTAEALSCTATDKTQGCSMLLVLGMLVGSTKVVGIPDDILEQLRSGQALRTGCALPFMALGFAPSPSTN
jgi:hypothetical protein